VNVDLMKIHKIIMADLMKFVQDELVPRKISCIRAGDTITVYYEIKEGEKLEHSF
jgi:large subunit ribosomal protein L19